MTVIVKQIRKEMTLKEVLNFKTEVANKHNTTTIGKFLPIKCLLWKIEHTPNEFCYYLMYKPFIAIKFIAKLFTKFFNSYLFNSTKQNPASRVLVQSDFINNRYDNEPIFLADVKMDKNGGRMKLYNQYGKLPKINPYNSVLVYPTSVKYIVK